MPPAKFRNAQSPMIPFPAEGLLMIRRAVERTAIVYSANLSLDKTFTDGSYLKNQVYIVKYDFELYSNFTFFLHDPVNGDQIRQKENRWIYGYQGTYQKEATLMGRPLRHELGIGLRYDDINGSELSRTRKRKITLSEVKLGAPRS
jgi:hypothetical protein